MVISATNTGVGVPGYRDRATTSLGVKSWGGVSAAKWSGPVPLTTRELDDLSAGIATADRDNRQVTRQTGGAFLLLSWCACLVLA